MKTKRISDEELAKAVVESNSVREALNRLQKPNVSGSTHAHFRKRIVKLGIDTSHFTQDTKTSQLNKRLISDEILVKDRHEGRREPSIILRRAMIEHGFYYECSKCGNQGKWQGEKLPLEIDHKNDNCLDNRPENLHFLCPNCHSLKSVNTTKRHAPRIKVVKPKAKRKTKKPVRSKRPPKGRTHLRKVERPSMQDLERLLKTSSFVQVGKMYGVSDNAVRKWLKHYRGIKTTDQVKKSDLLTAAPQLA